MCLRLKLVMAIAKYQVRALLNQCKLKVTRPSYFVRVPYYFEALWYSHLYFDRRSNL